MHTQAIATPRWSTSSFGSTTTTSATELSALREHLSLCKGSRGRWFTLHCAAETMDGIVAGRFVTTLAVAAVLIGVAALIV